MGGRFGGWVALGQRAENHMWGGYGARTVSLQISQGPEGTGSEDSLISVTWMAGMLAGVPSWRWTPCSPESPVAQGLRRVRLASVSCPQAPRLPHTGEGVLAPERCT